MKHTFKSFISLLLALTMVFCIAACNQKPDDVSVPTEVDDDFFGIDVENSTGGESTDNSQSTDNTQSTNSISSSGGTTSTNSVPAANKVGGKSWNEVLSSMPKKLRGTTVKVVNWNPMSEYTGATAAIKEFEKQTGIKVDWQVVEWGVYTTRLATMVGSGKSPDVVRTRTPIPSWMQSFQSLSAAGYDFTDEAWDQTLMKDYTINGVTYATSLKNTHLGSVNMMFYNKDLISKYDYEDPYTLWKNGKWTFSKFLDMARTYKKEAKSVNGCVGAEFEVWTMLYGLQGPVGYKDSKYYNLLGNEKFLTVTQNLADLYNKEQLFCHGRAEAFDASECLFYAGASVYLRRNNSYFGKVKSAGTFYAVPMPSIDGQSTYYQGRDEYEAYAIAKGAKNPTAVPYFLRYFLDGNNYDLNSFFCNKQNLEVYNWCMNQKNTIWSTGFVYAEDNFAYGSEGDGNICNMQSGQIKSAFDSFSYMIDNRAKSFNALIAQLSK